MESWILTTPFLTILLFIVTIVLLWFKQRRWTISVALITLALNIWGEVFSFNIRGLFFYRKQESDFKIMAFNIHGHGKDFGNRVVDIAQLINDNAADIVTLNEFPINDKKHSSIIDSILQDKYPYSFFDIYGWNDNAIYSQYPIIKHDTICKTLSRKLAYVTLDINGKYVSIINCHLSSNNYMDSQTKLEVDSLKSELDWKRYFCSIEKGYKQRSCEVDSIYSNLSRETSRLIILGDLNDVGGSYTLRTLKKVGMKDAWWEGGFGFGSTIIVKDLPFRLDHILFGNDLELKDVKVIEAGNLSDHKPVEATFEIR